MHGFNLRRLNNADVLFSYRVINSYSLVKAIKYEFSLYSYCQTRIKHANSSWLMHVPNIQISRRIPAYPLSNWYKTPYREHVKVRPCQRPPVLTYVLNTPVRCLVIILNICGVRPVLMVTEYTPVKRIPLRDSMHPMQTFEFYFTVDYYGELLKRVPPS